MKTLISISYKLGWGFAVLGVIFRLLTMNGRMDHIAASTRLYPRNFFEVAALFFLISCASYAYGTNQAKPTA